MGSWAGGPGWGGLRAPRQEGRAQCSAYAGSPLIPSLSPSAISGVAGKISLTASLEICGSGKT